MSLSCENTVCTAAADYAAYTGDLEVLEAAVAAALVAVGASNLFNTGGDLSNPAALGTAFKALSVVLTDTATLAADLNALTADAANVCCCIQSTLTVVPGVF
jgi:Na+-transporting NADH:ubiquinone oxidoreductase subunit NqrB